MYKRQLHTRRNLRIDAPRQITVLFQRPQRNGQHLLGDIRYGFAQRPETHRFRSVKRIKYQQRPFVAYPGEHVAYRAPRKQRILHTHPVLSLIHIYSTASAIWASLSFREAYTDGTKRGTFRLAATVTVLSAPNESPLLRCV